MLRAAPSRAARPDDRRAKRVAVALLGLVWLAFTSPMLSGKVHFPTDLGTYVIKVPSSTTARNPADADAFNALYPYHVYLGQQLRAGHFPLWDPSRFLGAPFAADATMGTFYPPNWLYAFGNVVSMETAIWAATALVALLLAYWFLRLLWLHPYAAALGAIVWTFSGFMVAWSTNDPVIGAAAWLPMALGGVELARRGRWSRGIPIAGLALALSLLGGHAQITYYVWLATGLWLAVSTVAAAASARGQGPAAVRREVTRGVVAAAGAFALGLGFAAIQLLGSLEYSGQIVRQRETFASLSLYRAPVAQLKTLLIPDLFGNPVDHNYWRLGPYYTEYALYVGVVALPLAVAGLLHRRRRLSLFFGLLLLIGGGAAFGTPLLRIMVVALPGMARFRSIDRTILLVDVALAGLAALGLDAILTRPKGPATRVALAMSLVLVVAVIGTAALRWGTPLPGAYLAPKALWAVGLLLVGAALTVLIARAPSKATIVAAALVALVGIDLWAFGFRYHPFEPNGPPRSSTPETTYLASVPSPRARFAQGDEAYFLPPNLSMVYGLYSLTGYDPFIPETLAKLLGVVKPDLPLLARVANAVYPLGDRTSEPAVLDLLGVNSLTAPTGTDSPGVLASSSGYMRIYDQAGAFPPAFVVPCATPATDDATLRQLKTMTDAALRSTVLVAPGFEASAATTAQGCTPGPDATLQRYEPQDVVVSVPAGPGGTLVLTDQWYPGWTATIDGQPAPIERVDLALRGVRLGPGPHVVEFVYHPRWPVQGLALTLLSLAVALLIATWPSVGRTQMGLRR